MTHEISVEHGDDWMSITVSKVRAAKVRVPLTEVPVIIGRQMHYRRAEREVGK